MSRLGNLYLYISSVFCHSVRRLPLSHGAAPSVPRPRSLFTRRALPPCITTPLLYCRRSRPASLRLTIWRRSRSLSRPAFLRQTKCPLLSPSLCPPDLFSTYPRRLASPSTTRHCRTSCLNLTSSTTLPLPDPLPADQSLLTNSEEL
jgi:hypothetical protein